MGSVDVFGHTLDDWNLLLAMGASLAAIITLVVTLWPKGSASSRPQRQSWLGNSLSALGLGALFGVSARTSAGAFHDEALRSVADALPGFIDPTVGHVIGAGAHALDPSDAHQVLEHANPSDLADAASNLIGP